MRIGELPLVEINPSTNYVHGTHRSEQDRLAALNKLTNAPFIQFLGLQGHEKVLEVGSGLGILASEVAGGLPDGSVIGVEYSAEQAAAAPGDFPNLKFIQGDAHFLPFPAETFDVVFCRYVLEHVSDPVSVLREMRRVLRRSGRTYVQENNDSATDWYPECPRYAAVWSRLIELQVRLGGDPLIGKKLFSLLKEAGFRDIQLSLQPEIHWQGCQGFETWVKNMIALIRGASQELGRLGLATEGEIEAAVAEVREFMEKPDATALFYWNRASALK